MKGKGAISEWAHLSSPDPNRGDAVRKRHPRQVELALLMYRLPRLTRMWTHLERQQGGAARSQGGVGLRGPGERQLEVDR